MFAEPDIRDLKFYQKRKKNKWREVAAPVMDAPIADTHAHLQMLSNPAWTLVRCAAHNVEFVCDICDPTEKAAIAYEGLDVWREQALAECSLLTVQDDIEGAHRLDECYGCDGFEIAPVPNLTERIPMLRIAMGVHPHNAKDYSDAIEQAMLALLADERTCAIGEVGLDYHYNFSEPAKQRRVFERQIDLAHETDLPLILHIREAHDEAFQILETCGWPKAGVLLHCYNLDPHTLEPWLNRDCYVAFGGPVTFKNADEVRESALQVPLNRLLTETDSPYMTPEPLRGVACGPEFTIFTAELLCDLFGKESKEEKQAFLMQLYDNALGLLNRKPTSWQQAHR